MEGRALVAETVLAGGKLTEVASRLGDNIVVELEDDAARGLVVDRDIELRVQSPEINNAGAQLQHARRGEDGGQRVSARRPIIAARREDGRQEAENLRRRWTWRRRWKKKGESVCLDTEGQLSYGWGRKLPIRGHQHQDHPDSIILPP